MTILRRVSAESPDPRVVREAADTLLGGGLVAYPTDTFYGLAALPTDQRAVGRLFDAKGRREGVAIPLIAASLAQVQQCVSEWTPVARRLADAFWPGPLTLVLKARGDLDPRVLAGETLAVRVPDHRVAVALAAAVGTPITSTSANRSGSTPARTADEVREALGDAVDLILDGGACPGGAPSTIVDATGETPALVREGAVLWSRVVQSAGS